MFSCEPPFMYCRKTSAHLKGPTIALSGIRKDKYSAMHRGEHVQPVRQHQGCRMGPSTGHYLSAVSGARMDRLDQSWFANSDVHQTSCRIEEGYIRSSGNRPLVGFHSRADIEFDQRSFVTRNVEMPASVVDVDSMRTS